MRTVLLADPAAHDAMRSFTAPAADINEHLFDVALHPAPLQCNNVPGLDETCSYMERDLRFDPRPMTFEEANM